MSYLVFCTFDLKNASAQDYQNAYDALQQAGLARVHVAGNGNQVVIPTTAAMGQFNGKDGASVCAHVTGQVQNRFRALRLKSEIFITAGTNWAWQSATT